MLSASAANGVLKRELDEAIPLCLARMGSFSEAEKLLKQRLEESTNVDQKSSALYCLLARVPGLSLGSYIDILKMHNEEPQVWSKIEACLESNSDQRLGAILNTIKEFDYIVDT